MVHMASGDSFYITTPIFYVNDVPHIGHAYTEVAADVLARWHRQRGDDTWLLTGTDEHGQKILRTAVANDSTPQAWVDRLVDTAWKPLLDLIDISNDDFIRTTDARHETAVTKFLQKLYDDGHIYSGVYEGYYCVACEEYKQLDDLMETKDGDYAGQLLCKIHGRPIELLKETNYFFRMSAFEQQLLDLYDRPGFIEPASVRNEIKQFVKQGLADLSITRSGFDWGIQVPWDDHARRLRVVRRAAQLHHRDRLRPGRRAVPAPLARAPHRRQGHRAVPRRHLARDAHGRGPRGAAPGVRPRLAARRRREDEQVEAHRYRAEPDHRHVRFGCVPLLLHARHRVRPGRLVLVGGPERALPGRARERFRKPRVPRRRDGQPLLRRRGAGGRAARADRRGHLRDRAGRDIHRR